jgi:DNA-binding transcriptional ArsR family regulator
LAVSEIEQHGSGNGRAPDVDRAVKYPARRKILRALLEAPEPLTVDELDDLVPAANLRNLNYHVSVLEQEECVTRTGEVVLAGGVCPTYAATVTGNDYVVGLLDSTRQGDERR